MRRIAVALSCAGIAAAAVAGCGSDDNSSSTSASGTGTAAAPVKQEKVSLRLNWVIAGNHAPLYLAKEKGFWSDCGLDVTMAAGKGSGDTAQLVATGSQDFGLSDAVSIVAGRSQGLPIKSLGVLYQTNPSAFVSKKDENITTIDDVAGKTFGAVPGGSPYLLAQALFKANGVKPGKEVSVPAPGIAQLKTGQADFITFFGNEVANIDPDWKNNLNVVYFKDAGQDIYGLALAASDDYAAAHPDQVKCLREGVIKGFEAAKANPDEALAALEKAEPTTKANPDVQRALLEGAFEYTGDDLLAENASRWEQTEKVLLDAGIAKKKVPASDIMLEGGQ
jgi:NitT/TauT family transport system substrate-binding protein